MEFARKMTTIPIMLLLAIILWQAPGETTTSSATSTQKDSDNSTVNLNSSSTTIPSKTGNLTPSSMTNEEIAQPQVEVKLLSEDSSGVTFQVTFPPPEITEEQINGQTFSWLDLPTNCSTQLPGKPQLPAQTIVIGIPENATIKVSAEAGNMSEIFLDNIPKPVPFSYPETGKEDFPQLKLDYIPDTMVYSTGAIYPLVRAEVLEKGACRGYSLVKIIVYPLVYNAASQSAEFCESIQVRVDFLGGNLPQNSSLDQTEKSKGEQEIEAVLQSLLLNYETAKNFKQSIEPMPTSDGMTPYDLYNPEYGTPWKMYMYKEGIYKISSEWLESKGFNPEGIDPRTIKVFCGDKRELYYDTPDKIPANDSIQQIPIYFIGEEDGSFDPGDYFIMYGEGTSFFDDEYNFSKMDYTTMNVYWLSYGGEPGLRMQKINGTPQDSTPLANSYETYHHYEQQANYQGGYPSLPTSSDEWYWYTLSPGGTPPVARQDTPFKLYNIPPGQDLTIKFRFQGYRKNYETVHHTSLFVNNPTEQFKIFEKDWLNNDYLEETVTVDSSLIHNGNNILWLQEEADPGATSDQVWFDWFEIAYERPFITDSDWLLFRQPTGQTGMVRYHIGPFSNDQIYIIDYSNNQLVDNIKITDDNNKYYADFQALTAQKSTRFVTMTTSNMLTPYDLLPDSPSNLHDPSNGADYLIIAYKDFVDACEPLASFRQSQGYQTKVINVEDIYEEFGRGLFDPTAIRNFLFYAYHNWDVKPAYVLLVGDAFFDYKNLYGRQNDPANLHINHGGNKIPAHYTSYSPNGHTPHDNWYACMDFDSYEYLPDIILSRICPINAERCAGMVNKIITYETNRQWGDWHKELSLVADNKVIPNEQGTFTDDCEDKVNNWMPLGFWPHKIYMESMDWDPSWNDPDHLYLRELHTRTHLTIYLREHYGSAWLQFAGHGSYQLWCHEKLFADWVQDPESPYYIDWNNPTYMDMELLTNNKQFPVVSQMSCNLAFFDLYVDSFSEKLLVPTNRGAIVTFGATRLGTESSQNYYHRQLYNAFFPGRDLRDPCFTVGQAYLYAKLALGDPSVRIEHVMLGDPAVTPPFPTKKIILTPTIENPVQRGQNIHFKGTVNQPDFNGVAVVNLYDNIWYCLSNNWTPAKDIYQLRPLNTVKVSVNNSQFEGDIIVPLNCGESAPDPIEVALQIYSYDEDTGLGALLNSSLTTNVVGTAPKTDFTGPEISINCGDEGFHSGDFVPRKCKITVNISDPSGVLASPGNTIENPTIPQPILLQVSDSSEHQSTYDLTERFQPLLDDPTRGTATIVVDLTEGEQTITVSAYDNFLNSNSKTVTAIVGSDNTLKNVLVCPNPFAKDTYFTFETQTPLQSVKIQIFTIAGRKIREITANNLNLGYNEIYWDGLDGDGHNLANGVYLYKLIADNGQSQVEVYDKLVVMR